MFEKLKSLFVVDDEEFKRKVSGKEPVEKTVAPTSVPEVNDTSPPTTNTQTEPVNVGPGEVTDKFTNILFGAIEKANKEGFDYLEFRNSLNSLKKMDMDEATRFKSAFAMAQTMKASSEKLISSAEQYLKILGNEEQKFGQALINQRDRQVGEKQQQLQQLNKSIRAKAEQIQKLSKEIEQDQVQLKKVEIDLQNASGKVEQTKLNFVASYKMIVSQIQGDVEKMKQYLK